MASVAMRRRGAKAQIPHACIARQCGAPSPERRTLSGRGRRPTLFWTRPKVAGYPLSPELFFEKLI